MRNVCLRTTDSVAGTVAAHRRCRFVARVATTERLLLRAFWGPKQKLPDRTDCVA